MGSQVKYKICPRCELNYIREDEDYCQVCRAELSNKKTLSDILEEDDKEVILCPVCKINYINASEKMCQQCKIEQKAHSAEDDWVIEETASDVKDDDEVSLSQIIEEEEDGEDEPDFTDEELLDMYEDTND